jgi:16S rRNA (cytosine1402-N4)-methyltransferase
MKISEYHIPVLAEETLKMLVVKKDGTYLDCTLGGGGHSEMILKELGGEGFLLGTDRDKNAIAYSEKRLSGHSNFKAVNISFGKLNEVEDIQFGLKFDGILLDLGVSSRQIDDPARGFSHSASGKLDMRMDENEEISAFEIINNYDESSLAEIFFRYGEEKNSRKIAKKIVSSREQKPVSSTKELSDVISSAVSANYRIKTLSRIFQAVRIEVNRELEELDSVLKFSLEIMKDHGRTAVISYHSLEDRAVKNFIKKYSAGCVCPPGFPRCVCSNKPVIKAVTKKAVVPGPEETGKNPRSRSAKLRIYEKI